MPLTKARVWSSYTPTISAASGSITTVGTVVGRYLQTGKTVFVSVDITITTNGTGAGGVRFTLPVTASTTALQFMSGKETTIGAGLVAQLNVSSGTIAQITKDDNSYPGADAARLCITGVYEAA